MTSYYGKTFVQRNQKKVYNYEDWITSSILRKGLDPSDNTVTDIAPANVFDNKLKAPRTFGILSKAFKSFTSGDYNFILDRREIEYYFGAGVVKEHEKNSMRIIGTTKDNSILLVDTNEMIYMYQNSKLTEVGTIETIIGLDSFKAPVEHSEIKIFGKLIPVGIVLAYQLGLTNLINILKANPRRVPTGQRVNLQDFEYQLVFADETLIFNKDNKLATMILSGFNEYHRSIKNYQAHTFDKAGVYLNILQSTGITVKYLREIDLLDKLFIDPITRTLLESMKEPTTFKGLLFRSSELLLSERHPDLLDMQYMRIKGYERIAGAVYTEMIQSIRAQKSKTGRMNQKIDLHPYAVWQRITADPSNNMVVDINPLQNLKEIEAITFGGVGGRISRSMTKSTREYHENDKGVISESTVDSGDVAINTFSSANPIFNSLLGTVDQYNNSTGNASLLSSSALLSVAATNDD